MVIREFKKTVINRENSEEISHKKSTKFTFEYYKRINEPNLSEGKLIRINFVWSCTGDITSWYFGG